MKRLRYSVPDDQWKLIEQIAIVFSLDPKLVLQFATSIGLRFLDMSLIHPVGGTVGKAIDERAQQGAEAIVGDFSKAIAQDAARIQTVPSAEPQPVQPKKVTPRKKVSRKRK